LCGYSCTFSEELSNIVWDLLFVEGIQVLFKAGIVFLENMSPHVIKLNEFYEVFNLLNENTAFLTPE